jgi:hypothetical protein
MVYWLGGLAADCWDEPVEGRTITVLSWGATRATVERRRMANLAVFIFFEFYSYKSWFTNFSIYDSKCDRLMGRMEEEFGGS